jgi:hypothetical protein
LRPTGADRRAALAAWRLRGHYRDMTLFVTFLLGLTMLGVLTVLGFGVASMMRGGDPRRSNRLMQARVLMQGLALLLLAILLLLSRH